MPLLRTPRRHCRASRAFGLIGLPHDFLRDSCLCSRPVASLAIKTGWFAALVGMAVTVCGGTLAAAADEAPAFTPEDISIGEPISLPFATPLAAPSPGRPPAPPVAPAAAGSFPIPASQLPSVIAPAPHAAPIQLPQAAGQAAGQPPADTVASFDAAAAGNGWLGISVDDTMVTGRLVVVEVAPDGPAAKAGVRPQDMLLAINGVHLQNGDEMAAALAAIMPGQRVKMAVGRDNQVEDVVAQASARPPAAVSREWQSATANQNIRPSASAAISPAAPPDLVAPTRLVPEPLAIGTPPAPVTVAPTPTAPGAPTAPGGRTALGVRTVPVDPNVQSRFRLSDAQGAFVIGVVQNLPASKAGVPPGSVIVAINHQPVRSPQDLTQLVARGPVGTPVLLQYVLPGGQSKQAEVVLQSLEQPLERALIGSGKAGQTAEPPMLEPAPLMTRRVERATAHRVIEPDPLIRVEELLGRLNNRLEQIERRLERLESGR